MLNYLPTLGENQDISYKNISVSLEKYQGPGMLVPYYCIVSVAGAAPGLLLHRALSSSH